MGGTGPEHQDWARGGRETQCQGCWVYLANYTLNRYPDLSGWAAVGPVQVIRHSPRHQDFTGHFLWVLMLCSTMWFPVFAP